MPKRYLVTAGLPYSNGRLHVGHIAGAYLPADTYVRYLRATGREACFICGSDDNGVSIEIKALKEGKSPQEVSSFYHAKQRAAFAGLRIEFDIYGGTHQPGFVELHERLSQQFFLRMHAQGYFTKRTSKQLFDPKVNRFLPDSFVKGTCHHQDCRKAGAKGDQCESCGRLIDPLLLIDPISEISGERAVVRETTHWYLRLAEFEKPLSEWLETKREAWRPAVLNFALGQIKQGLPERAMTRDIAWGIPVPLPDAEAQGKVLFVWFDAPIGYVSFTAALCRQRDGDERGYEKWWCDPDSAIVHFIGEDNTVFHTLIWPAMLMGEGRIQLPTTVVANNFVNFRLAPAGTKATDETGEKISKSKTPDDSPVWIEEYLRKGFDPDALRYYLTAIAPESARTAFDPADFIARNNNELVAALGNFVNRALTFAEKYFEGRVPDAAAATDADRAHLARGDEALRKIGANIEGQRFRAAMDELMLYARDCNQYFGSREPWRTRKDDLADCGATINTCVQAIHLLAVLMAPFMPGAAQRILQQLGVPATTPRWEPPAALGAGHRLGVPQILFPKLEPNCMDAAAPAA